MIPPRVWGLVALMLLLAGMGAAAGETPQQSGWVSLACVLSATHPAESPAASEQPQRQPHARRGPSDPVRHFAEKVTLAGALDRTAMKLASPLFGGKEAGRLANMLSNFGGGSAIAALGVGYLAGGVGTKHVCGRAFEAAGEAMLITGSLKFLTGRMRPRQSGNDPDEFRGPGSGYGSFPSGHTSNAFALASVLAYEHPKRRWLYYGLATGVGLARLQQRAHYLSDVVAGATIGIYAGRSAVTGHTIFGRLRHVRHKLTQRGD